MSAARNLGLIASALFAICPMTSRADTVVINTIPGVTQASTHITGFSTFGDDMVGMTVTAYFTDATSQQLSWAATGPGAGGVSGTSHGGTWILRESGDTFSSNWILGNNTQGSISRVVLDGVPGKTVFDRTNPNQGTIGSAQGLDFVDRGSVGGPYSITVTYIDQFAVSDNGYIPVGDEWTRLEISFGDNPLGPQGSLTFGQDADNATVAITPAVPEPATLTLLGFGGLALAGWRRMRKQV